MKNSKNSRNITKSFIRKSTPNSHEVKDAKYYEDAKGNKYYVDGKNVVIDYSVSEKNVANWLKETFGGEIYMLPRINIPEGIQTADYLFRGEKWDLKDIKSTGKNVLDNRVNGLKKQANNFIFDIIYDRCEIIDVYTVEKFRNMGIATKLINEIINDYEINNITLEVSVDNCVAIKLYEMLGFKSVALRKEYYNGTDAFLMLKEVR